MKLPALPFLKKEPPKEYFLALLLQEELLTAVVFEETNGVMHTIGEGRKLFPVPLDDTSFEEILDAADKAISQAESALPNGVQSHKTIFGVKEGWTENLQIKKEHLATLKQLCTELDLQPIGFLVFAEAIAHLLQKQEGAPVSGIFIEMGSTHMLATLLRAGRVIASQQASVSTDLPTAVDSLLAQFTDVEILPSRIIVLDTKNRPNLERQFLNHSWSKQLPFLHVPQITMLTEEFASLAILFGTATQMGFAMPNFPQTRIKTPAQPIQDFSGREEQEGIHEDGSSLADKAQTNTDETLGPEDEGETNKEATTENEDNEYAAEESNSQGASADNFGFVQESDVLETLPHSPKAFHPKHIPEGESEDEFADETFADIPEEVKEDEERSMLPGLGAQGVMITEGMKKVLASLKRLPVSKVTASAKKLPGMIAPEGQSLNLKLLAMPAVIILIIAGILWYFLGVKATATLILNPKTVEASQDVTFSTTDNTNLDSNIIGGTIMPVQEDGKVSTNATGQKAIGNKAKGTLTIYNIDSASHTLSSGTQVTSSNGLKFTLDNSVTVASGSSDPTNPSAGTGSVNVTASDIGTDYNLPSGTKFTVSGQDSALIAAKNANAFSGGTKQTVTVVSQADLDKLVKDLTSSLSDKAKQDMQKSIGGDKAVLPDFVSTDLSNKQFDHIVGDQTSTVNLSATISFEALTYSQADVNKLAQQVIASKNTDGNINTDKLAVNIQNPTVSKDGKSVTATLAIKGGLLPKIDTTSIAERLTGKSFDQATNILSDIPQLASVKASLSPNLFFLPHTFPHIASHIMVGIASNE